MLRRYAILLGGNLNSHFFVVLNRSHIYKNIIQFFLEILFISNLQETMFQRFPNFLVNACDHDAFVGLIGVSIIALNVCIDFSKVLDILSVY